MSNVNDFVIENGRLQKYIGEKENVVVPDNVISIEKQAFAFCESVTSIVIPNSVTVIGDGAFEGCKSLVDITLPTGIGQISRTMFYGCSSLQNIAIPDSVTTIGGYGFCECSSLKSITIPKNVTEIQMFAFSDCTSLTSLTLPIGATINFSWTEDAVFSDCGSLKTIIFYSDEKAPEMPEWLKNNKWLKNEQSIPVSTEKYMPASIRIPMISLNQLTYCKKEAAVGFMEAVCGGYQADPQIAESYNKYISKQRKKLYELIPTNSEIFQYLINEKLVPLADIDFCLEIVKRNAEQTARLLDYKNSFSSKAIAKSEEKAMAVPSDTEILKSLFITKKQSDGTLSISTYKGADEVVVVPGKIGKAIVSRVDEYAFSAYKSKAVQKESLKKITEIVIGENIKKIDASAFSGCSALKQITLPASMAEIHADAFRLCDSLEAIRVHEDNPVYYDADGILCGKVGRTNHAIRCPYAVKEANIPESVKVIGDHAFENCESLTTIRISEKVTRIGSYAFTNCRSLTSVSIPGKVKKIATIAFWGCENLEKVTMTESVTEIGSGAFSYCPLLTIHAPAGSYAEKYAKENNIPFVTE